MGDAVLLAADDADLDLEDDLGLRGLLEQLRGDLQVLVQSIAEPSHMCDWNSGFSPRSTRSWDSAISGRT